MFEPDYNIDDFEGDHFLDDILDGDIDFVDDDDYDWEPQFEGDELADFDTPWTLAELEILYGIRETW